MGNKIVSHECEDCNTSYEGPEWQKVCKSCFVKRKNAEKAGGTSNTFKAPMAGGPKDTEKPEQAYWDKRSSDIRWQLSIKVSAHMLCAKATLLNKPELLNNQTLVQSAKDLELEAFGEE